MAYPPDALTPPRSHATAFKCASCGLVTTGRLPRAHREPGNGTYYYPRRHKIAGLVCPGVYDEAEWVTVEYGAKVFGGKATA
jgi:hypothetical protein